MIYIVLDTNIFVRIWTQAKRGNEVEILDSLLELAAKNVLRILVPEIVKLEVDAKWRTFPNDLGNAVGDVAAKIEKALEKGVWNEIEPIRPETKAFLEQWKKRTREQCEERFERIQGFLRSEYVQVIAFTPDIMCHGKRLMIGGRMSNSSVGDQDAFIAQSLISFFTGNNSKDATLLFCCENASDFAVEAGDEIALRHEIRELLPRSSFFRNLQLLLESAASHDIPPEPATEVVRQAEDAERAINDRMRRIKEQFDDELAAIRAVERAAQDFRLSIPEHQLEAMRAAETPQQDDLPAP